MEYSHIQLLTDGFKPQDTLDFKYESLMDITDHFRMDDREDMKIGLKDILHDRLKSLISEYEARLVRLKSALVTFRHPYY